MPGLVEGRLTFKKNSREVLFGKVISSEGLKEPTE